MGGKFELGRISGLPVVVDATFLLLILLWGQHYFLSGNVQQMSAGIIIVIGLGASILLHELAHAYVGRYFGVAASHIELNGMGGLCYWASAMRSEAWPRIAISIAGPLANLTLYYVFRELAALDAIAGNRMLRMVLVTLSSTNFLLFVFNMLPAFPLDGGKTLEAVLSIFMRGYQATRIVAMIGILIALWLVFQAQYLGLFTLLIALLIGLTNWQALNAAPPPGHWR